MTCQSDPDTRSWKSLCYMVGSCPPAIDLEDACRWSLETPGGTAGSQSIQLEACPSNWGSCKSAFLYAAINGHMAQCRALDLH